MTNTFVDGPTEITAMLGAADGPLAGTLAWAYFHPKGQLYHTRFPMVPQGAYMDILFPVPFYERTGISGLSLSSSRVLRLLAGRVELTQPDYAAQLRLVSDCHRTYTCTEVRLTPSDLKAAVTRDLAHAEMTRLLKEHPDRGAVTQAINYISYLSASRDLERTGTSHRATYEFFYPEGLQEHAQGTTIPIGLILHLLADDGAAIGDLAAADLRLIANEFYADREMAVELAPDEKGDAYLTDFDGLNLEDAQAKLAAFAGKLRLYPGGVNLTPHAEESSWSPVHSPSFPYLVYLFDEDDEEHALVIGEHDAYFAYVEHHNKPS